MVWSNQTLANLSLRLQILEQQDGLQPSRRSDWAWRARDEATDLLEHAFQEDLPRYEDRQSNQIHCYPQGRQLSVFTDSWWKLPRHLTES